MLKQFTNPMVINLTEEQFKLAAQMMNNVVLYLNTCERENKDKIITDINGNVKPLREFEFSQFLEEF